MRAASCPDHPTIGTSPLGACPCRAAPRPGQLPQLTGPGRMSRCGADTIKEAVDIP